MSYMAETWNRARLGLNSIESKLLEEVDVYNLYYIIYYIGLYIILHYYYMYMYIFVFL